MYYVRLRYLIVFVSFSISIQASLNAEAESSLSAAKSSCQVMWEQHDRLDKSCAKKSYTAECKAEVEQAKIDAKNACGVQASGQDCKSAMKELSDDEGKLNSACGSAGIEGSCFSHINKCLRCQGSDPSDPLCETMETVEIDEETDSNKRPASINDIIESFLGKSKSKSSSSNQLYAPSASKARVRYKNCPALSRVDLEKWMDRSKDAQKTVRDKKKEIVELEERGGELSRELRESTESIDEDAQKLVDEASSVRNKIQEDIRHQKNETRNNISKILDAIDRIEEQLISSNKAYGDAQNAYLNALSQLDQQCHAAAVNKLNAMQIKKQELIKKSQFSVGSFNSLVAQVGISNRKRAQLIVARYFRQCKTDPSYKASATAAKRALDSAKKTTDNAIRMLRERQDKMEQAIKDANERDMPEALKEIVTRGNESLEKIQNRLLRLEKRKQNVIRSSAEKKQELMKKIMLAKQELDVAEQVLKQSQAYLNAKMAVAEGVSAEAGKVGEAMNAFSDVTSSAGSAVASCGCDTPPKYATNKNGQKTVLLKNLNYSSCVKACDILVKSSSDWDPDTSITDSTRADFCENFDRYPQLKGKNTGTTR